VTAYISRYVSPQQPDENSRSKRSPGCSRSRKKSFLRMRGTTVPRKEQNKAFDEEIEQPGKRLPDTISR